MQKSDSRAKVGFILGLISIIAWIIPIFGLPITICAIVFSSLGFKSTTRKGKAIAGLVLGIVFLVLSVLNGIVGVILAVGEEYATEHHVTQSSQTN